MNLPKGLPMPDSMPKPEIIRLLLTEEYGFLPAAPTALRAKARERDESFCAGKAVLEKISLTCDMENGSFRFPVYYICPTKAEKPLPCFIHINFRDLVPDKYLPAEEIVDAGYAVLCFCYKDVSSDDGDFRDGLAGVVYPEGRTSGTQCGKIGLWAWAASRVMDYALTRSELDPSHICVAGHSRLGKTALLAGAMDERFYCAFSNDSGCSGTALSRGKQGETVRTIYDVFPYWFCKASFQQIIPGSRFCRFRDGCYTALAHYALTEDASVLKKLLDDSFRSSFINRGLMTCAAWAEGSCCTGI